MKDQYEIGNMRLLARLTAHCISLVMKNHESDIFEIIVFGVWLCRRAENGAITRRNGENIFIFKIIYGIIKYIRWNAQNLSEQGLMSIIMNVDKSQIKL